MKNNKEKIIGAAEELFYQIGYEKTSVDKIIQKTQLSKGTFYHYFESKEILLENILKIRIEYLEKKALEQKKGKNALDDFVNILLSQKTNDKFIDTINSSRNLLIHKKANEMMLKMLLPILKEVVCLGIEQEEISNKNSQDALPLLIMFFLQIEDLAGTIMIPLEVLITSYVRMIEQTLGVAKNELMNRYKKKIINGVE